MNNVNYSVHPKERIYYFICLLFSGACYYSLICGSRFFTGATDTMSFISRLPIGLWLCLFLLFFLLGKVIFMGMLRGNGVEITATQFPDIYETVKQQATALKIAKIPHVYLLHQESAFNAFATRFGLKNYVVLYNAVLETAYEDSAAAVEFIIGHELGHIKRGHTSLLKTLLIFPALCLPFLGKAYSRACEYTCDNIGQALSPTGAQTGILILAAGKTLHKKVNTERLLTQFAQQRGFSTWLAEILSTHPHLLSRIKAIRQQSVPGKQKPA